MTCRDATKTRPHRRVFFRLVGGGGAPRGVPYAFPAPFPPAYPRAFARGFPFAFSYASFLRFPVVFRSPFFWISRRSHSRRPLMSRRFAGSPQPRLANRRRNGYASPSCGAATTRLDPIWHAEIGTLGARPRRRSNLLRLRRPQKWVRPEPFLPPNADGPAPSSRLIPRDI